VKVTIFCYDQGVDKQTGEDDEAEAEAEDPSKLGQLLCNAHHYDL